TSDLGSRDGGVAGSLTGHRIPHPASLPSRPSDVPSCGVAPRSRMDPTMTGPLRWTPLVLIFVATFPPAAARAQADAKDWPMYNYDVLGSRYHRGERAIGRDNAGRLEEKGRFPAQGSGQEIGAIHATPVVVDGYVYFGTASATPRFYKLTPDGKVRWSYRNPEIGR